MGGENYQAKFVCGRAAAWDKPRSETTGGPLAVVAAVGRPPYFFGKNDECGFRPKAAYARLEMKNGDETPKVQEELRATNLILQVLVCTLRSIQFLWLQQDILSLLQKVFLL